MSLIKHLPENAANIADEQGWNDLSIGLLLLGTLQGFPGWEDALTAHFKAVQDEENPRIPVMVTFETDGDELSPESVAIDGIDLPFIAGTRVALYHVPGAMLDGTDDHDEFDCAFDAALDGLIWCYTGAKQVKINSVEQLHGAVAKVFAAEGVEFARDEDAQEAYIAAVIDAAEALGFDLDSLDREVYAIINKAVKSGKHAEFYACITASAIEQSEVKEEYNHSLDDPNDNLAGDDD